MFWLSPETSGMVTFAEVVVVVDCAAVTKVTVSPQVVASLAQDGVVVGIKDSSRDFEYFSQVVFGTRGIRVFRVFTGSDTMLLASLRIGADGTIAGGPNLEPRFAVEVYRAFLEGDWDRAVEMQEKVLDLVMATRRGMFPAGIKAGLEILGICDSTMAPPVQSLSNGDRAELRKVMEGLGLLPEPALRRIA